MKAHPHSSPSPLPLISVCMACHNEALFIKEALQSLLDQTLTDWECVLVDDASTDCTVEMIKPYLHDTRIRLIANHTHNHVDSLNRGWEAARGKYIVRMDADDRSLPERLQTLYNYMETHTEVAACGEGMQFFGESEGCYLPIALEHDDIVQTLTQHNCMAFGIFRRSFMEEKAIRYDPNFPYAEDYRLWCDIVQAGGLLENLPVAHYAYRVSGKQKSRLHYDAMMQDSERIKTALNHWLNAQTSCRLTVIIPFLNEKEELKHTLASIRETAGNEVEIIVIDDASDDGYPDYKATARRYGAAYHRHATRQGVARSRDEGVDCCRTPYFLLLDAHMRVYHNNWWRVMADALDENDRILYCGNCKVLDDQRNIMRDRNSFGAFIPMEHGVPCSLDPVWNQNDNPVYPERMPVACVLGACYAMSKRYWHYLRGLEGLLFYGCDETYLSMKVWMEGGECLLLKQLEFGHIFRDKFPYQVTPTAHLYNKLLIAELLLPPALKGHVFQLLSKNHPTDMQKAWQMLIDHKAMISELKTYYQTTLALKWERFGEINKLFH